MDFATDNNGAADAPSHGAGDPMVVVRDALLSQLQQDSLRQEIIAAELAKIERAIAQRNASPSPTPRTYAAAAAAAAVKTANETTQPKKPSPSEKCEPTVQKPMPPSEWSCAVCNVQTTSERNRRDHCGGQKHQAKVAELEKRTKAMAGGQKAKTTAKPSPGAGQKTYTARWGCSICCIECNGEWDFDTHLKGKKHQANTQALLEQSKKSSGNSESLGTKVQSSNANQHTEKKAVTWIFRVCQEQFTCQSDLQNHLKVKRHHLNLQAINTSDGLSSDGSSSKITISEINSLMDAQKEMYFCKVCSLKCTSKRTLSDHLRGKKHLKQLAFCEVCKWQCESEEMLSCHRYGKKHRANLEKMLQAKLNAK